MTVGVPAHILDRYADWSIEVAWDYNGTPTTWRLTHPDGRVRYLKVKDATDPVSLRREAEAMRWTGRVLRVPTVVEADGRDGVDWLITDAMLGQSAIADEWRAHPDWLVPIVARGLRAFHDALPIDDCPFRLTIPDAIAQCRLRLDRGVESFDDLHEEHQPLGLEGAYAELVRYAPASEDLVVCHGDYCFPNVFIEDGLVTGYVDLGELNVADRWWDIAVGMWSTTWNVGPGYEAIFASAYGIDVDDDRLRFYRLLYDLIS